MQRVTPPRGMASVGPQVRGDPTHCGVRRPRPRYFLRNVFFLSQQGYGTGMRPPPNSLATNQVLPSMNM